MARARNIKPGFFANEMLAECDPLARLLFAGLWCLADRDGRLEDRPKRIRAEILPYDQCDPDGLLTQLEKHGFILRYAHGEQRFIQVLNFGKHQNPHVKEAKSTIPSPFQAEERNGEAQDEKQPIDDTAPDKHQTSTGQAPCEDDPSPERAGLIPDSGFLIPDSLRNAGEPAAEPDKPTRPSRGGKTLKTYLAECREAGIKPIPDSHYVRAYIRDAGITEDMAAIAWLRFREDHTIGTRKDKRYSDWPAAFANSVKDRWYRLWLVNPEGAANWTNEGLQAVRVAEAQQREAEVAA
jgi:hypothetical protein